MKGEKLNIKYYELTKQQATKHLNYMYYTFRHISNPGNVEIVKVTKDNKINGEQIFVDYLKENDYDLTFVINKQEEKVLYNTIDKVQSKKDK